MKKMIVKHSDIGRCSKVSLSAQHYRPDGTCRCDEREQREQELEMALDERRRP